MTQGKSLLAVLTEQDATADSAHSVIRALAGFDQVRRLLNELLEEANEGRDDDVDDGNRAIQAAIDIQSIVADMADTLRGVAAQHAGLAQMVLDIAEQRNAALQQAQSTIDDIITNVAATLNISPEQARNVLIVLSTPDDSDVMEMDITDLRGLLQFREQIADAASHLGYSDEE